MKSVLHGIGFLLVFMVACTSPDDGLVVTRQGTSLPTASPELSAIDSLMWRQPDSALKVMMEFAGSEAADGLDAFEGHYCQVMVAELLYKNFYKQSNRDKEESFWRR